MSKTKLLSIDDAAARGIERLRKPIWANPLEHLKIDIFDGRHGPWLHLWCPINKECNGRDPVDVLFLSMDCAAQEFVPYDGPLPESDEYKKAVAIFDGCMSRTIAGA